MEMNRKAVFFSISALLIVGLLFFIVRPSTITDNSQASAFARVQNFNQNVQLIQDSSIPLLITAESRKGLNNMAQVIRTTGTTALIRNTADFQREFEQCVLTGVCLGAGMTFDGMNAKLLNLSNQYNQLQYNTSFQLYDINLTQIGTWTLLVQARVGMYVEDEAGFARVEKNITVEELISIEGLIDPLASRKLTEEIAGNNLQNPVGIRNIRQHQLPVTTGTWTPAEFVRHARNGTYIRDTYGPSYIGRFMETPPRDQNYGIRSLWPPGTFQGMQQRSYADYNDGRLVLPSDPDCFLIVGFGAGAQVVWDTSDEIILLRDREAVNYLNIQAANGNFQNVAGTTC